MVRSNDDFYFIGDEGKVMVGTFNLSGSDCNGLLPAGEYTFDENGKLVKDGLGLTSLSVKTVESETGLGKVNWYADGKTNYLYLPACADPEALVVSYTTAADDTVYCGGQEMTNDSATSAFASESVSLSCNGNAYDVVTMRGSSPSVFIKTQSNSIAAVHGNKEYKEPGEILIVDEAGAVQYDGALDYIKGRGNTTWNNAKKPYNIKLGKKTDLFGMGKSKKWCLLANAADSSLVRNPVAYSMAQQLGITSSPSTQLVDLYIDGNYMGVYLLTEKVEIDTERVDIFDLEAATEDVNDQPLDSYPLLGEQNAHSGYPEYADTYQYVGIPNDPENITGGYLLELEKTMRYMNEASGFITKRQQAVVVKSPEYASKAQVEYIRAYWQEMEDALYSPTGYNAQGKYYADYLDIDSLAAIYIVQEFCVNFDGCNTSFYLYKDVDGKIFAGPAWDFDIAFGENPGLNLQLNNTTNLGDPNSLYIQHCYIEQPVSRYNSFLAQLYSHDDFQAKVQELWNNAFQAVYSAMQSKVSDVASSAQGSVILNSYRWGTFGKSSVESIKQSYNSKVDYIRSFMTQRYAFLSQAYAEDAYYVKYDVGDVGKALVHDVNIYSSGDTAIVQAGAKPLDTTLVFDYWSLNPDGTGTRYYAGDKLTVTGNIHLYAQWKTK